ncbi:MAG: FAS1 domain-containing protein [Monoraphidium minutum]|nr:MAG: FAS1 domain-containing protein [Monoraphidium minutum]
MRPSSRSPTPRHSTQSVLATMAFLRAAVAVLLLASVCTAQTKFPTALSALESRKDLSLFTKLAEVAGLRPHLNSTFTRATIFAPTDAAILAVAKALKQTPEQLIADSNHLLVDRVIGNHIVLAANAKAATLKDKQAFKTAGKGQLSVGIAKAANGKTTVSVVGPQNKATVVGADLVGGNTVIHVIDAVLLPNNVYPTIKAALAASPTVSTLAGLIAKDPVLSKASADPATNVTLFAPYNKAFETLAKAPMAAGLLASPAAVSKILAYHAVKGAHVEPHPTAKMGEVETEATLLPGRSVKITKVMTSKAGAPKTGAVRVTADSTGAKPATVKYHNIIAGASYINVIDGVLVPKM